MTIANIISALTIHLILPILGLLWFLKLNQRMRSENIHNAPIIELFIIFSTYGGLLLVVLTEIFWLWSGMASLGVFYLIIVAPLIMGIIAYTHKKKRTISKYHNWTYLSGLLYFAIAPVTLVILFLVSEPL